MIKSNKRQIDIKVSTLEKDEVLIIQVDESCGFEDAKKIKRHIDEFFKENKYVIFSGNIKISKKKWWEFWK